MPWGKPDPEEDQEAAGTESEEEALLEPVHEVHVDALVLLKIMQHCPLSDPAARAGSLLGMDVDGVQQVTNCYALPNADQEEMSDQELEEYQTEMLRLLREVNVDNNCVGWYQTTNLGSFFNQTFIDTQFNYQRSIENAVVLVYDPMQTSRSNVWLKAFRLTPEAMRMKLQGRDGFTSESVLSEGFTPDSILEEIPVRVRSNPMTTCLLADMGEADVQNGPAAGASADIDFERLHLATDPFLEKNLEFMCAWVDDLGAEMHQLQAYARYAYRQKQEQTRWIEKRKEENMVRQAAGEEALPLEDPENPVFRQYPEPSRLESLMISKQISHYCHQINAFAGMSFSKLFLASSLREA